MYEQLASFKEHINCFKIRSNKVQPTKLSRSRRIRVPQTLLYYKARKTIFPMKLTLTSCSPESERS
jgi:hypothetical protein